MLCDCGWPPGWPLHAAWISGTLFLISFVCWRMKTVSFAEPYLPRPPRLPAESSHTRNSFCGILMQGLTSSIWR
jgi:hypothetical protein